MKFAIIRESGRQYLVKEGDIISFEKLHKEEGEKVNFPFVVFYSEDNKDEVGAPFLEGKKVEGEVVENGRGDKIRVVHKQPKKRMLKVQGHKQHFTKVKITKI